MARRTFSISSAACLTAALLGVGCGGSTLPRTPLPSEDQALLRFLPEDAFVVGRFDGRAFRQLPNWPEIDAALEHEDRETRLGFEGTDLLYGAIGGLIDAPELPPDAPDDEGNYPRRPEWASLATAFGGKLPTAVAVVKGSVSSVCTALLLDLETHDAAGFHYGSKRGVTIATREGDICLVTFEPVFEHLLQARSGPSVIARRLSALAEGGDLGVASAAIELDMPSFRGLVDTAGSDLSREGDDRRYANLFRQIYGIVTSGVDAVEWRASFTGGRYRSLTRVQASDEGRGVMWREFSEVYFDILRAIVANDIMPEEGRAHLRNLVSDTHVEPRADGFVIAASIDDETVSNFFAAMAPDEHVEAVEPGEPADDALQYQLQGSAAEVIALAEPQIEAVNAMEPYARTTVVVRLAAAYATVGRFDDAKRILEAAIADYASGDTDESYTAQLRAGLVDVLLATGHVAEAETTAAAGISACESSYCGAYLTRLKLQAALAKAQRGDFEGALAAIDGVSASDQSSMESVDISAAQIAVFVAAGRYQEASAAAHVVCGSRPTYGSCIQLTLLEAEALAHGTAPLASVQRLLDMAPNASVETTREGDELMLRAKALQCTARVIRSPNAAETRTACSDALEASVALHGELHPETAMIRVDYARALTGSRDAAGASAQLAKVDATIATLGPTHPLRTARSGSAGRPAATPRRGH